MHIHQVTFSEDGEQEIKALMDATGLKTQKEFLNNAITFFGKAVQAVQRGRVVAEVDEKNMRYTELTMEALMHAALPDSPRVRPSSDSSLKLIK